MEKENKGVRNYYMSDAESEVMEKLWEQTESIKQSALLTLFVDDGKAWKRQTLNTFLERLEKKGLVERDNRMVKSAYSKEEYHLIQMEEAIDDMYGGKLSNFVAAFAKKNTIDEKETETLMNILNNY
ncbi:MAG: BlaI/MecI/CopY family transcriptional regulator [Lachnospiraceae bacterium]|nr:BlaI/MecI/CopY family transcriptional regulator [Lachnospiraceae bacterium]